MQSAIAEETEPWEGFDRSFYAPDGTPVKKPPNAEVHWRLSVYGIISRPEDGRMLLVKDGKTGLWGLPGGRMEHGEHWKECLIRETREETGYRVEPSNGIYHAGQGRLASSSGNFYDSLHLFAAADLIPLNQASRQSDPEHMEVENVAWKRAETLELEECLMIVRPVLHRIVNCYRP